MEQISVITRSCSITESNNIYIYIYVYVIFFSVTEDATTYPCRICGRRFLNKKTMWNHTRHCGKEPRFVCVVCAKKFKQKHHLQKHLKTVHKHLIITYDDYSKDNI